MEKVSTGIEGFDFISNGGLPKGRTTLVSGSAGSAKTIFAVQYLARGILDDGVGVVFVTFEETPADIRKNMASFGWDIEGWEKAGKWAFVDASPNPSQAAVVAGEYNFAALIARIENAIERVNAQRVSLDSLGAVFSSFQEHTTVRRELLRLAVVLKSIGVTAIITSERVSEYGEIARFGVEEFVADNVIILRNVLDAEKRRRTMEILKFRGTDHQKGEYPFTVVPDGGIVGLPLSAALLEQRSSTIRICTGSEELNAMCGGGFFRDSIVLISGATGTGKTLLSTGFMSGVEESERGLFFAFEESRAQLFRNAAGWGYDFEQMERDGRIKVLCAYPESSGLDEHLLNMKSAIEEFKPTRIAVDSLSALERDSTAKSFREFVIGLTAYIKHKEIAGLFTSVTPSLTGGSSITEAHISTITDSIILLRYVELFGEISRGIAVLKMRGSAHEKQIREFKIGANGMQIKEPFRIIAGLLSGNPVYQQQQETERLGDMFLDDPAEPHKSQENTAG